MNAEDAVAYAIARVVARKALTEMGGSRMPYLAQEKRVDEMAREMVPDLIGEAKAAIEAHNAFQVNVAKTAWTSGLAGKLAP